MNFFLRALTVNRRLSTNCSSNHLLRLRAVIVVALLCAVLAPPCVAAANPRSKQRPSPALGARVDRILNSSAASRGFWGIEVAELPSGRILFNRDAQHLFHPASNMKLFTTAAALEKLGQDFAFRTTVECSSGPDSQGIVQLLYLVGRGDPTFCGDFSPPPPNPAQASNYTCTALEDMAAQVRARGVLEVFGPLVADDSYFDSEPYMHGWTVEDMLWGYGATVSALSFNSDVLLLRIKPALKLGDPAQVSLYPFANYYQLNNSLVTAGAASESHLFVERGPDSMRLDVWGQIPLGAGETDEHVAIAHPAELVGEIFRQALEVSGTVVKGGVQVRQVTRLEAALADRTPPQASPRVVLAEHDSLPLR
jgi:D-alanyl-D-alanine carboxypeptidase/D-alanyl-D-alanine-endopeptidase (penicillin-binding protein 4)